MVLSEDVLLKIDKTVLAEVLLEEGKEEYNMLSSGTAEDRKLRRSFQEFSSMNYFIFCRCINNCAVDSDKESEKSEKDEDKKDEEKEPEESKDIFELMREEVEREKDIAPEPIVADGDSQVLPASSLRIIV